MNHWEDWKPGNYIEKEKRKVVKGSDQKDGSKTKYFLQDDNILRKKSDTWDIKKGESF